MLASYQASKPTDTVSQIWSLLEQVKDPEIPVISIIELGIVRNVDINDNHVVITITPTYSGCPAMHTITSDIQAVLQKNNYANSTVRTVLAPPWTTDWISESGREKLNVYGIAPPLPVENHGDVIIPLIPLIRCPRCHSLQTRQLSEFGSTACKALYQCNNCMEPFDYFKPL